MRFFFYGTLIAGSGNAVAAAVHAKLRDLGPATVRGALHAIPDPGGWYPALSPGEGEVHGRLYEAGPAFAAADLAALDLWEDFDPAAPASSLYLREPWLVTSSHGHVEAQTYRLNRSLPEAARPIADGDFRAWLAREGLPPFGE